MIKRLLKIANELDRKGFRKEADTLDKIAQDWVGRPDSFADSMGGQAEKIKVDMASLRSGAVEKHDAAMAAEPGKIRPAGDRFTYDYISEGDYFVVATAPEKQSFAVGAKLEKGTPAYDTLFNGLRESDPEIHRMIAMEDLRDRIIEDELKAPDFGGHSGMQNLRDDVAARTDPERARAMLDAAADELTIAYKNKSLTRAGAEKMLVDAGFSPRENEDYLSAISPIFDAPQGQAPEAADIQALEGPAPQ